MPIMLISEDDGCLFEEMDIFYKHSRYRLLCLSQYFQNSYPVRVFQNSLIGC